MTPTSSMLTASARTLDRAPITAAASGSYTCGIGGIRVDTEGLCGVADSGAARQRHAAGGPRRRVDVRGYLCRRRYPRRRADYRGLRSARARLADPPAPKHRERYRRATRREVSTLDTPRPQAGTLPRNARMDEAAPRAALVVLECRVCVVDKCGSCDLRNWPGSPSTGIPVQRRAGGRGVHRRAAFCAQLAATRA